eukprot:7145121-Prymnesium_polylepis.5
MPSRPHAGHTALAEAIDAEVRSVAGPSPGGEGRRWGRGARPTRARAPLLASRRALRFVAASRRDAA